MTARFHLQPLLDLANTRTDEAARKLGELVAAERDVEQKLKMLEDYRQEYNERFVQAARRPQPLRLAQLQRLHQGLDDAIGAQRKVVEQSRAKTVEGQQAWLAQRTKLKAFDTLSLRHQQVVSRQEARQEQKQSDEHAARRARGEDL